MKKLKTYFLFPTFILFALFFLTSCNQKVKKNNNDLYSYILQENYEAGRSFANSISGEMENNADYLIYRGVIAYNLGKYKKALNFFKQSEQENVKPLFYLYSSRAKVYVQLNEEEKAINE